MFYLVYKGDWKLAQIMSEFSIRAIKAIEVGFWGGEKRTAGPRCGDAGSIQGLD